MSLPVGESPARRRHIFIFFTSQPTENLHFSTESSDLAKLRESSYLLLYLFTIMPLYPSSSWCPPATPLQIEMMTALEAHFPHIEQPLMTTSSLDVYEHDRQRSSEHDHQDAGPPTSHSSSRLASNESLTSANRRALGDITNTPTSPIRHYAYHY